MSPDRSGSPTRAASARRGCHCNRARISSGDRDGDGQRRRSRRSRRKRRWWRRSAATGPRTAGRRSATAHGRLQAGKNAPAAVLRAPSARPRRRKSRLSCPFGVPQVIRGAQGITPPRQAKIVVNLTSVPCRIAAQGLTNPITLILDNARYQKCHIVLELAKSLGFELLYLPTYSPNLNLIERLWKFVKKDCLYSTYYNDFALFKQAISSCLAQTQTTHRAALDTLLSHRFQTFKKSKIMPG